MPGTHLDLIRGRQVVIPLRNNSGESLPPGTIVVQSLEADTAFEISPEVGNPRVLGVLDQHTELEVEAQVVTTGYVRAVLLDEPVERGDFLTTSSRAGYARGTAVLGDTGVFGVALENGAESVAAYLFHCVRGPRGESGLTGVQGLQGGQGEKGEQGEEGSTGPSPAGVIFLTAGGGWPATTLACVKSIRVEYPVNGIDLWHLDFEAGLNRIAQWTVAMPSDWDGGDLSAQFYWTCEDGEAVQEVRWGIQGIAYIQSEAIDQVWGEGAQMNDALEDNGRVHISAKSSAFSLTGNPQPLALVQFRIIRHGSKDTLATVARLLGVMLFYERV